MVINQYQPPVGRFPAYKRIAHFLNEGAIKAPLDFFTHQDVADAIFKNSDTIVSKKVRVNLVKNCLSRTRDALWDNYGKGMESARGVGVRATVGAADAMSNDIIPHQTRLFNSTEKLSRKITKVDRKELKKAPMGKLLLGAHTAATTLTSTVLNDTHWTRLKQLKQKND
jgi:hypothetical protein